MRRTPFGPALCAAALTMTPLWAAAADAGSEAPLMLDTLDITDQVAATKTRTPYLETPQSVSVITGEQIDEQGSETVQRATRYTPGVFANQIGASNRYDYLVLRGFSDGSIDNTFLDGLKLLGDAGTFTSLQVDPYFLERIEVVKGPASVLYGRASPGGIVALTSKQPLFTPYRQVQASVGNQNARGLGFDVTGAVGDSDTAAFRLTGLARNADTQFDHLEEERYALAPSLALNLGTDTRLTLRAYLQNDPEGGSHSGLPAEGTLFPRNGRTISRHFFEGEPAFEAFQRKQNMIGYELEHAFGDTVSFRQNARYVRADVDLEQVYAYGWASETELNRYFSGADEELDAFTIDNQLQFDFATGTLNHRVLAGLDYQDRNADVIWESGSFPPIDAFDPEYGADPIAIATSTKQDRSLEQTGIYLQDQLAAGQWRFSLGGRYDWVEIDNVDPDTGEGPGADTSEFSGRAGALYRFDSGVSPYLSYSESFRPNSQTDDNGELLAPTRGTQYEAGVKVQPGGPSDQFSVALFRIDLENVATKKPNETFYRSLGEIRSQGIELEARTRLTEQFDVRASYTYNDVTYERADNGTQGNDANMAPRHRASVWGNYRFHGDTLRGLQLGLGATYTADLWADPENTRRVPDYTIVDFGASYDFTALGMPGLMARLNINNLFDRDYVASCFDLNYCYYGSERTVRATVSYEF